MSFLGCPCYCSLGQTNWAPISDRCQGLGRFIGLTFSLGLASGPTRLFSNPINLFSNPINIYIYIYMLNYIMK